MWWRWLVGRPVVEWRVVYWVACLHIQKIFRMFSLLLDKVVAIYSLNDQISESNILISLISKIMGGDGWLVDQLLNGGLYTGFWASSWTNCFSCWATTMCSSGPISMSSPKWALAIVSVACIDSGLTYIGTPETWASFYVIGAGLSVTKFLRAPLVTLASKRLERLSASLF